MEVQRHLTRTEAGPWEEDSRYPLNSVPPTEWKSGFLVPLIALQWNTSCIIEGAVSGPPGHLFTCSTTLPAQPRLVQRWGRSRCWGPKEQTHIHSPSRLLKPGCFPSLAL